MTRQTSIVGQTLANKSNKRSHLNVAFQFRQIQESKGSVGNWWFYLAFAYIPRSREIASHVTSSSVRVLTSSKVACSTLVCWNNSKILLRILAFWDELRQRWQHHLPNSPKKSFLIDSHDEDEEKDSPLDESNSSGEERAAIPRRSQQNKDQTAASLEEISLLTDAILGLTKSLPELLNPPLGREKGKGKGKRLASSPPDAVPTKKAKVQDGKARSSMSASEQSTDCETLYDSVLNSKSDESEQNTTQSGDDDGFLSELVKEYESDDTVGESLKSEKLAKLVDKIFCCKLSEKNLKDRLKRQERPANCETAKPAKVNPGIWRRLRELTKKRD